MTKRYRGPARLLPVLALVAVPLVPRPARAQLDDVTWLETVSLSADGNTDDKQGSSLATPDPLNGGISGGGYSLSGSVSFFSDGPPAATTSLSASYTSGLSYLIGTSTCKVSFEFRVVQTAAPPVAVTTVPVRVTAYGSVETNGDPSLRASAWSALNLATASGSLVTWEVSVTNDPDPSSDSFNGNTVIEVAPDTVVSGDLNGIANITGDVLVSGTTAGATALFQPGFAVADQTIPGTSASYRDYFDIEYAPGYWALGQYPVKSTTWGKIKTLYDK